MDGLIVAQVLTFAGVVVNLWYTWQREARQRQWQKEDANERHAVEERLAHHTTATADALAVTAATTADRIETAIAANTDISAQAFTEANTVNQKLEALGVSQNKLDAAALLVAQHAEQQKGKR